MKKVLIALLCLLFFCVQVFSQATKPSITLDEIVARLQTLSTTKATEKVYLHLDRTQYNAGDTLYFKAYLTLGEQHQLSKLNGILHVDLLNAADSLVKNIELQTNNGLSWGDLTLSKNLPKGTYHVRAYTKWMLNNADPDIFDQPVIVNSSVPQTQTLTKKLSKSTNKFDIQFFAEGGTFVDDIPAKLAFKSIDEHGKGADVKGVVIDNLNTEVTKFEAKHLGMGIVFVTPVEGRTYKAKLTYPDGTKAIVDLPKAYVKGMTLLVNNDNPDKLLIEINASRPYFLENKNKEISVVIYSNGSVRSVKTVLDSQVLDLSLAKKDFQTGIVRVTLFSNTREPMNERLSFIQNNDLINIQTTADKQTYAARGKVHIALNAKKDNKPVTGYFSASVIDATKIPVNENAETTILSNLLLTSELKGIIEQPNYYFNNVTNDTRANLDVLMLTQGYRRFEWKQLLSAGDAIASTYPVEKGIDITGTVTLKDGSPVENGNVTLLTKSGGNMLNQTTDAKGRFTFPNLVYDDKTPFVIQAKTSAGKSDVLIVMGEPQSISVAGNSLPESDVTAALLKPDGKVQPVFLADASGKMLKEVVVTDKSYIGPDRASQTINNSQLKDQGSMVRGLEGRLNGVKFNNGVPYLTEKTSSLAQAGPMMIVLDDVQMYEGASIDNINVTDVESVKVLKNNDATIYGVRGANGVIVIKTLKTRSEFVNNKIMAPGLLTYAPKGFYKARTFYSPAYGGSVQDTRPDLRSTIYWNPDLVTDKDGSVSFDYFNADGKGSYRIVIEGIDENGNIGRSVYIYKVE